MRVPKVGALCVLYDLLVGNLEVGGRCVLSFGSVRGSGGSVRFKFWECAGRGLTASQSK